MPDVVIVGGGLSGLALADRLEQAGVDWLLIEARSRFGGRIKVLRDADAAFDLGPSWFWPGQDRMAAMAARLNLTVFDQHATGELVFEDEGGTVHRGMGYASMEGSLRIAGGMMAMIDGLVAVLPAEKLRLGVKAATVIKGEGVQVADGAVIAAKTVVLCVPPRVAAGLEYVPALDTTRRQALQNIPTWMGGQAKFVATYDSAFWRDAGLSGDAMSRRGPLVEIHDASAMSGPAALFGFVGVPVAARQDQVEGVVAAAVAQLGRLFGEAALTPRMAVCEDWAFAPETASVLDHQPLGGHPRYGLPPVLQNMWDGALMFAATEAAPAFGGFLEGALESAEITASCELFASY